jgi:hypothetical protein
MDILMILGEVLIFLMVLSGAYLALMYADSLNPKAKDEAPGAKATNCIPACVPAPGPRPGRMPDPAA